MSRGPSAGILVALWIGVAFLLGVGLLVIGIADRAGELTQATVTWLVRSWYVAFGGSVLILAFFTWRAVRGRDGGR